MNLYFQSPAPVDRATTMAALRDCLDQALGLPLWIHPAPWLENEFEDFVAVDRDSALYVLRWMEPGEMERGLFDLMRACHGLQVASRESIVRRLKIRTAGERLELRVVIVGPEIPREWVEVASTLAPRVVLLKIHCLRSPVDSEDSIYFESRGSTMAKVPVPDAEPPTPPVESPHCVPAELLHPAPTEAQAGGNAEGSPIDALTPPPEPAPEDVFTGLDPDEVASFKALEEILGATRLEP